MQTSDQITEAEIVGSLAHSIAARYDPETNTLIIHPTHYDSVMSAEALKGAPDPRVRVLFSQYSWA